MVGVLLVCAHGVWAQEAPLIPVRFLPHWIPQAQFAGYYMAREKGFFTAEGLDVTVLPWRQQATAISMLEEGGADFVTSFVSAALVECDSGRPVVNISQTGQRSALLLVAKKSSGIETLADLNGKKIGFWPEQRFRTMSFLNANHINAELIPQGPSISLLLRGAIDAMSVMWYNEYHLLLNAGLDPEEMMVFRFDQYGLSFPEEGLYCRREMLEQRRDVCNRFVRASIKGWEYAFEHSEETLNVVMQLTEQAHTGSNSVHQKWMLERMKDIMTPPDGHPMGWLNPENYKKVVEQLTEQGIIKAAPSLEEFHVPCYR